MTNDFLTLSCFFWLTVNPVPKHFFRYFHVKLLNFDASNGNLKFHFFKRQTEAETFSMCTPELFESKKKMVENYDYEPE